MYKLALLNIYNEYSLFATYGKKKMTIQHIFNTHCLSWMSQFSTELQKTMRKKSIYFLCLSYYYHREEQPPPPRFVIRCSRSCPCPLHILSNPALSTTWWARVVIIISQMRKLKYREIKRPPHLKQQEAGSKLQQADTGTVNYSTLYPPSASRTTGRYLEKVEEAPCLEYWTKQKRTFKK